MLRGGILGGFKQQAGLLPIVAGHLLIRSLLRADPGAKASSVQLLTPLPDPRKAA